MINYFGRNIKYLRKQLGLTQTELGEKLGKAKTTIAGYELETRHPKVADLREIAIFFKVNPDRLMNEDLSMKSFKDVELQADWIREELVKMEMTDKEFDLLENYIQFLKSQRKVQ